jgi:hypothetical protein
LARQVKRLTEQKHIGRLRLIKRVKTGISGLEDQKDIKKGVSSGTCERLVKQPIAIVIIVSNHLPAHLSVRIPALMETLLRQPSKRAGNHAKSAKLALTLLTPKNPPRPLGPKTLAKSHLPLRHRIEENRGVCQVLLRGGYNT